MSYLIASKGISTQSPVLMSEALNAPFTRSGDVSPINRGEVVMGRVD